MVRMRSRVQAPIVAPFRKTAIWPPLGAAFCMAVHSACNGFFRGDLRFGAMSGDIFLFYFKNTRYTTVV